MSIQAYITNVKKVIRRDSLDFGAKSQILDNAWQHIVLPEVTKKSPAIEFSLRDLPTGKVSVPLAFWLDNEAALKARGDVTVQINAEDDVADLVADLSDIDTVIIPFRSYVDGRSYSHVYLLRKRHAFKGEIRAVGDVHHDQLNFLARCGVNAFELPEGENLEVAQQAFNSFSQVYQPSADNGRLIFSTRRAVH